MDKPCDYAKLKTSRPDHGPAVHSRGGYDICQKCYDGIIEAERRQDDYYKASAEEWAINERSKALQRKCFL